MNKSELVVAVAEEAGITQADAGRAVNAVFGAIQKTLVEGGEATFVGFGSFHVGESAAREGRNPATGAAIKIPARKSPKFRAGKALKDAVNKG